jgi:hypothetical protein
VAYTSRVLVVTRQTADSDDLRDALLARAEQDDVAFTLLMPAAELGLTGREASKPALDAAVARLREAGVPVEGICGDHDPIEAVVEVCQPGAFDEVIVVTLPGQSSRWLRADLPARIHRLTDLRVHHIVARPHTELHTQPAPQHEREPLGPLTVLGWGHSAS